MREVTKAEFRDIYFRLGGGRGGWSAEYWERSFERDLRPGMRFLVEEPEAPHHDAMWIVSDYGAGEYRLFFRPEEESDRMMEFPEP
jgi:hypothetical protein